MVVNQGRKRAKRNRKLDRQKKKKSSRDFGVVTTDSKGNKRILLG